MTGPLSEPAAVAWIRDNAFQTQRVGTVGVELEWLVNDQDGRRVPISNLQAILADLGPLPRESVLSFEPGGQLEVSTVPAGSLAACVAAAHADLTLVRERLRGHGVELIGHGLDWRVPERLAADVRYDLLESHYDRFGPYGRVMMCNTASVQVCLDAGGEATGWQGRERRWWLANLLGPVLLATFANSPGRGPGAARSLRQLIRFRTDPSRTDPPSLTGPAIDVWTRYALDANSVAVAGTTMRAWLRGPTGCRPSADDLRRHLKTVIPPVRACGHLEFRMIDAQPDDGWVVPVAVIAAVMDDPDAAELAASVLTRRRLQTGRGAWIDAARRGLANPELAATARSVVTIAIDSLGRSLGVGSPISRSVANFANRYTGRGRCPGDDVSVRPRSPAPRHPADREDYLPGMRLDEYRRHIATKHAPFAALLDLRADTFAQARKWFTGPTEFDTDDDGGRGESYRLAQAASTARLRGMRRLMELSDLSYRRNAVTLDVFGGDGLLTRVWELLLARPPAVLTGDLSPHMVRAALDTGLPAVRQAAQRLLLRDRTVDVVVMAYGTHHLPPGDRRRAFEEAARVLKRDGRLVVHDFEAGSAMASWFADVVDTYADAGHDYEHFTRNGLADLLSAAGFSDVQLCDMRDPLEIRGVDREAAEQGLLDYVIRMYGLGPAAQRLGDAGTDRAWLRELVAKYFCLRTYRAGSAFIAELPRVALAAVGTKQW